MQRIATALAVAALLVLSGCSLPFTGGSASPPGIADGGVQNETALVSAHTQALSEQSYETDITIDGSIVQNDQAVEFTRRQQVLVEEGFSPYQYRVTESVGSSSVKFDVWANDTAQFVRIQNGGNVQYQRGQPQQPQSLASASFIDTFVDDSYTVEKTEEKDGHTYTTLTSQTAPENVTKLVRGASDVSQFEGTIIVDETGRVHAMSATMDYALAGSTQTMQIDYQLLENDSTVEKPSWVSGAA
ncbi:MULTISPECIES: hypothetical protein [unclassified Haladaptatus]|uniref:DUF7537 family lipoprotein n=1 Tax=unclassified Haladaptatus TaxID=2622732 RepID=UPI0023E802AE|nr:MULTISPECIES: hypothetical protein [unclassified Haladaptatus]